MLVVMRTHASTLPAESYHFQAAEAVPIRPAEDGKRRRTFSGVAYAGGVVNHPWWGPVGFDLSTTQAAAKIPVLILHDRDQRAGFAALDIRDDQILVDDGVLLANPHGKAIAEESDEGFPWQLSVHIEPGRIEEVQPGASAVLNGHDITGPAIIFRDSQIREVSFTPTGVDSDTHAVAASHNGAVPEPRDEEYAMKLEELQAKVAQFEAQVQTLTGQSEEMSAKLTAAEARATEAEGKLAAQAKDQRLAAVKEMFGALGKDVTDEDAAPYLAMDDATFATVQKHLQLAKPTAPAHLFQAQATGKETPAGGALVGAMDNFQAKA
jgi:hypothetical protein